MWWRVDLINLIYFFLPELENKARKHRKTIRRPTKPSRKQRKKRHKQGHSQRIRSTTHKTSRKASKSTNKKKTLKNTKKDNKRWENKGSLWSPKCWESQAGGGRAAESGARARGHFGARRGDKKGFWVQGFSRDFQYLTWFLNQKNKCCFFSSNFRP